MIITYFFDLCATKRYSIGSTNHLGGNVQLWIKALKRRVARLFHIAPLVQWLLTLMGATYHCGIRVPAAYRREIEKLYDPNLKQPYRVYIVRRGDKSRKQLWNMGVRIERKVFWETDGNTPLQLFLAARRWLRTTVMVVAVDQRPDENGIPRNFAFEMMRLTMGSSESLITLKALRGDPWFVEDVEQELRNNAIPQDAGFYGDSMDISMIAVLREYRRIRKWRGPYYDDRVQVSFGLLAQTCVIAEVHRITWWFTILNWSAHAMIVKATGVKWNPFAGLPDEWRPYFGSEKSMPFWCLVEYWIPWLAQEEPEKFARFFPAANDEFFAYDLVRVRDYGYDLMRHADFSKADFSKVR